MAVKDFSPENGDAAYTMGIVDLLLECVELSYRPGKYCHTFANQMRFFRVEMI
jgi:hypothetical protein